MTAQGRYFELTLGVFLWEGEDLPVTFQDWIKRANLGGEGASTTTLNRVVELRHPPAKDIIARRHEQNTKPFRSFLY